MKTITCSILFLFTGIHSVKSQKASVDNTIIGTWKGTSICQVKNSPCHDEVVVYHITKAQGTDTFSIAANKIVNGKEVEMGIIGFKLDRKNIRLLSTDYNSFWTFNFKGKELDGTLVSGGSLYRIIKLTKQQ